MRGWSGRGALGGWGWGRGQRCSGWVRVCRPLRRRGTRGYLHSATRSLWDGAQGCSAPGTVAPRASPYYAREGAAGAPRWGMSLPGALRLLKETHACPAVLDLLFPRGPGELVTAMAGPCTLRKGHREAGAGLSQLRCLISVTCFTGGS